LRAEDEEGSAYNLVGFQTRMTWPAQKQVFRLIPGLEAAEFERYGSVHRNTFVHSPTVLNDELEIRALPGVFLAGQITGVEGYVESAACGMVVGITLAQRLFGKAVVFPPTATALGALVRYLRKTVSDFQPSNIVWSMFDAMESAGRPKKLGKRERGEFMAQRALTALQSWLEEIGLGEVANAQPSSLRLAHDEPHRERSSEIRAG
jgi:methylenetetrahydrofolate--tRNA-(uracil-5-)-methyltransferase